MDLQSFDILVAKSLTEGLDADEQISFNQSLIDNHSLFERYEQMKLAWDHANNHSLLNQLDDCKSADFKNVWRAIEQKHNVSKPFIHQFFKLQNIAASIAFALLLSSLVLLHLNVPGFGKWVSYSTKGKVELLTLPDGTEVTLNEFSSITYLKKPQSKRLVRMKGEAYFHVATDSTKPFIIDAGLTTVEVLGTQFNLIVNNLTQSSHVFVTSGLVSFSSRNQKIFLSPKESASYEHGKISKKTAVDDNQLFWKTGKLTFLNASLDDVLQSLADSFDQIDEIRKLNTPTKVKITTKFDNQSIDDIFKELELHFNKKFVLQNNILIISD